MKKGLFVRLSDDELEILRQYCIQVERTQSDVIREFVRRLKKKIPASTAGEATHNHVVSLLNLRQPPSDAEKRS